MENKFRASRYVIDGMMIDFGKEIEPIYVVLFTNCWTLWNDVLDPLGNRHALRKILEQGTGADWQLKVHEENNSDIVKVTEFIENKFLA
ncbi:hypothetical protein BH10BAC3_BH10BAC3_42770 [soil metagenome]